MRARPQSSRITASAYPQASRAYLGPYASHQAAHVCVALATTASRFVPAARRRLSRRPFRHIVFEYPSPSLDASVSAVRPPSAHLPPRNNNCPLVLSFQPPTHTPVPMLAFGDSILSLSTPYALSATDYFYLILYCCYYPYFFPWIANSVAINSALCFFSVFCVHIFINIYSHYT